jgi:hypothetical protein
MNSSDSTYLGAETARDSSNEFNALHFMAEQLDGQANYATLVRVEKITVEPGTVGPIGQVHVKPLVNQLDGRGKPMDHEKVYGLPYLRMTGGKNGIIIDPKPGNIGLAIFADRDISGVKKNKKESNPGSRRRFDMADGLFLGAFLEEKPEQYIRFTDDSIEIVDKNQNKYVMDKDGIRLTAKGGAKINMKTDGTIEFN